MFVVFRNDKIASIKRDLSKLAYVFLFFVIAANADMIRADETTEQIPDIIVEQAVMTPATAGGTSQLRFKITNLSSNSVKLIAVRACASKNVRILMDVHDNGHEHVSGLLIRPEETLSFSSSHIRVELANLTRDIKLGTKVEFHLEFQGFSADAVADVH